MNVLLLPDSGGEALGGVCGDNYIGVGMRDIIGDKAVREIFVDSFFIVLLLPTSTLSLPVIVLLSP